ncbi:MAG: hypothetical protein OEV66_05160 [Spirochaetia bacterium]|nr:hypothetical protein [Spirochaetia bacterium]
MEQSPGVNAIVKVMKQKNYTVFEDPRGHDLNIVGLRTKDMTPNTFNDWMNLFYRFDGRWNFFAFPCTTDPGTYWLQNPMNVKGTAILKPGQYRKAYSIGMHFDYRALVQSGNLTVYRDANRDNKLDVAGQAEDTGSDFGVNIHRSHPQLAMTSVDKWSAGCQVFQDPDHYAFFLKICDMAAAKFTNSFTYTLLTEEDFG